MGLFNKLFGSNKSKEDKSTPQVQVDNNRLVRLLDKWGREENEHCFKAVLQELFEGSSVLLLPVMDSSDPIEFVLDDETLYLHSVYQDEDVSVLSVFSDSDALRRWNKDVVEHMTIESKQLFDVCRQLEIGRIIINPDQPNMFVLERQKEEEDIVEEEEALEPEKKQIRIGIPADPLNTATLEAITNNVSSISFVEEIYQYIQENIKPDGRPEYILMIGVLSSDKSEESRDVVIGNIKQALQGQKKPSMPVGIMLIEDKWVEAMTSIGNEPFYKKL